MGRPRRDVEQMLAEIRRQRDLQYARLARDYSPSARRLLDAYNRTLPAIEQLIFAYPDRINLATLLSGITRELNSLQTIVFAESSTLQTGGIRAGLDLAIQTLNKGGLAVRFNQPLLEALNASIGYVDSQAFIDAVEGYGAYHAGRVGDLILTQLALGKNPNETARLIWNYFTVDPKYPLADIENLTRTLQNYSARRGASEVYKRNGVTQWIWVANIGNPRTCLSCIMLQGTVHDIEKEPFCNDHHRGRCSAAPVTPTWASMGLTGGKEPLIQTGVQYFDSLSDQQKQLLLGTQLFKAYAKGLADITPETVVGTYENSIFGTMRRVNSNAEILSNTRLVRN